MGALRIPILFASCAHVVTAVTPVQKVTDLLEHLSTKLVDEGHAEAAAYDKYSCFCKEEADDKLYAIEKSTKKIARLDAEIGKLGSEIADLDTSIGDLSGEVSRLEGETKNLRDARQLAHETFLGKQAEVDTAIGAVERATQALKESKTALDGKAERDAFAEMSVALSSVPQHLLDANAVSLLAESRKPGKAYTYKYHANEIISILDGLKVKFEKTKSTLEQDEFNAATAFDLEHQDLMNEKKFTEKEQREKEALRDSKDSDKTALETDKGEESSDKLADESFLKVLKEDCENKAVLWDQRSQSRAAELQAIGQAVEALKTGVAPNWKANKKLVGLQQHGSAAPSFLQMRSASLRGTATHQDRSVAEVTNQVQQVLMSASKRLGSPVLSIMALKVSAAEDHFVKVRQIIKDLIEKLRTDASAEQKKKQWCDTQMAAEVSKRDDASVDAEKSAATIAAKEVQQKELKQDVVELTNQIAENKKALAEATELRTAERLENTKTEQEAGAGKAEVEFAITTLNQYYSGSFIQRASYGPPDSDRDAQTVADKTPEIFDSEYAGAQDASKGIIGMLEVILADFDRTEGAVSTAESDAQSKFDGYKSANEGDTQTKEGSRSGKEDQIKTLEDDLVTAHGDKANADTFHQDSVETLKSLKSSCVDGESYGDRIELRKREIEALKEAHSILEDWQK